MATQNGEEPSPRKHLTEYTVRIGDVCFAALGQIVNRPYAAVRYASTRNIVVASPVDNVKLREALLRVWGGPSASPDVMIKRLSRDLPHKTYSAGAAMRLLYYFPTQGAPHVVKLLKRPSVSEEFVRAVSWTTNATVREELLALASKTRHPDLFLAALPGLGPPETDTTLSQFRTLLDALPPKERGSYGKGHRLLKALLWRYPDKSNEFFTRYLSRAGVQRRMSACHAFLHVERARPKQAIETLAPLLDDTRLGDGWTYAPDPDTPGKQLQVRVCDAAASAISRHNPRYTFDLVGSHADLDKTIHKLKRRIRSDRQQ